MLMCELGRWDGFRFNQNADRFNNLKSAIIIHQLTLSSHLHAIVSTTKRQKLFFKMIASAFTKYKGMKRVQGRRSTSV